ncbi:D-amino-acid transaminase [Desulfofustis glycolicus]|uniref:branched-chain-amino-acid transaminase n=1 Tax=Desulfofustis glycolicus DSM 9705 TaxID=1121409 RepID=A0A1M5ULK0_9BACT|nr:D-amino-acid transaminase [Desulfofustis glycolicus]MCB2217422.1 D-amino-acid transaminase [Desulfobulbaceae bacterium]SHH63922.1 D-alanine transaminase [Desulfofustis glycolicus DSM 9705]
MDGVVFLNGEFVEASQAKVSVFDRGYLFGDGVYEVLPVIGGKLIDQENFLIRLKNSLAAVGIRWPYSEERYLDILEELMHRNEVEEGGVYTQVTRGVAAREFAYPRIEPCCMAFAFKKALVDNPLAQTGVAVVTVDDIRWKRRDIKSISLIGQCMAKQQSVEAGAYEGWMVEDGYITEGTSSTAYICKDDTIITRPLSRAILPGIRRKSLLKLAEMEGVRIEQRLFTVEEAYQADEAFLSSATTIVLPVISIDGKTIGNGKPGKYAALMRQLYIRMAADESPASRLG